MRKNAIYISIVMRDGEIFGVYVGSATSEGEGYVTRIGDHKTVKLKGYLTKEDARSEHRKMDLYLANGWHIRSSCS
jgi:hypothetical protein